MAIPDPAKHEETRGCGVSVWTDVNFWGIPCVTLYWRWIGLISFSSEGVSCMFDFCVPYVFFLWGVSWCILAANGVIFIHITVDSSNHWLFDIWHRYPWTMICCLWGTVWGTWQSNCLDSLKNNWPKSFHESIQENDFLTVYDPKALIHRVDHWIAEGKYCGKNHLIWIYSAWIIFNPYSIRTIHFPLAKNRYLFDVIQTVTLQFCTAWLPLWCVQVTGLQSMD